MCRCGSIASYFSLLLGGQHLYKLVLIPFGASYLAIFFSGSWTRQNAADWHQMINLTVPNIKLWCFSYLFQLPVCSSRWWGLCSKYCWSRCYCWLGFDWASGKWGLVVFYAQISFLYALQAWKKMINHQLVHWLLVSAIWSAFMSTLWRPEKVCLNCYHFNVMKCQGS